MVYLVKTNSGNWQVIVNGRVKSTHNNYRFALKKYNSEWKKIWKTEDKATANKIKRQVRGVKPRRLESRHNPFATTNFRPSI